MRHLYKPYGMMSHHNIVDVDSEFANRWVCTETEDNREIKLHPSLDFPDWCPLKVIPNDLDMAARQKQQMGLPYDYCREICDQYNHCSHRNAETCQSHNDKILLLKEHDIAIRNAVLDELGILHDENAKRFNEQLDHPEPLTPEARDLVIQAKEIAQAARKEKGCPYWNPDVNIYPDEPDNHCTCQFSDISKKALTAASAIRILDLEQIISLSDALLHQFPDDLSIKMSKQQASQELKRLESLQSEITNQRSE